MVNLLDIFVAIRYRQKGDIYNIMFLAIHNTLNGKNGVYNKHLLKKII